MLQLGRYELHAIVAGSLRLDGGSMFGVVPRVLWSRQAPPDEHNRIALVMRLLLAVDRSEGRVILVDSGAGDHWSSEQIQRFGFSDPPDQVDDGLQQLGLSCDDVTDVICTHLHFDHNSGLTVRRGADLVPRFAAARHWIHRDHLAYAPQPTPKDRASFVRQHFEPLITREMFRCVEGMTPPADLPDVEWMVVNGHTTCQLLPRFCDGHTAVQFVADLVPTTAHLPIPWVMAYDNQPLCTLEEKRSLYELCARRDVILFFEHDAHLAAARIDLTARHPAIAETVTI